VRIFRPLVGTAIGAAVLGGGLALSLTAAGAATTGTHTTTGRTTASQTSASTSTARSSGSTAVQPKAVSASSSPSRTAKPKHKCTNMPGRSQSRPGSSNSPASS
jgi:ABC-type phosphate transport system substrate-binding protein